MVVALFAKGRSHLVPAMVSAVPLSSMVMLVMLLQFWNASSPMVITEAGMVTLVIPVPLKPLAPTEVTAYVTSASVTLVGMTSAPVSVAASALAIDTVLASSSVTV